MDIYKFPEKNTLPHSLIDKAKDFVEFRNGASQVTIITDSGSIYKHVLLSNCSLIIAVRGYDHIPFLTNEIKDIFQSEEDVNPENIHGWKFFS